MLDSLDHVVIAVDDLEAATGRYAALLGRRPSWRGEHPGAGTSNALFRLENTYIELLGAAGSGPLAEMVTAWIGEYGEGLVGLAFATRDAEDTRRELAARGMAPGPVEPGSGREQNTGSVREWSRVPLPAESTRGTLLFAIEHRSSAARLPVAEPTVDAASAVTALDHVVIQTADADATKRVYGEGLGLRLALDRRFPDWGMRLLFFRVGGVTVEVAAALSGDAPAPPGSAERDRLWGLCYRVADADLACTRLAAAGFDVSQVRTGRKPNTRVFTVRTGTAGVPTLILQPAPRD